MLFHHVQVFEFPFLYFLGKKAEGNTQSDVSSIVDETVDGTAADADSEIDQAIESELLMLINAKFYENYDENGALFSSDPSLDGSDYEFQ